jgi:NAD(P)-dependent dehydrogenase (short-subunit alcohol dehydrogenase family)
MKTVLITGGTSGIGKATAIDLIKKGYQVIFTARNKEKADKTLKEIESYNLDGIVDYVVADLRSKKEVVEAVSKFKSKYQNIDILINNAGVTVPERRLTEDGMEETFQVNHLSHFIITNLLLDELMKSNQSRIINVSSGLYSNGKFEIDNLQSEKHFEPYRKYSDTKLMNILFTFELADRLKGTGITVNTLHPGVVRTNFGHELRGFSGAVTNAFSSFYLSPEKGALTSIYLATSDEVKDVTGKYFVKCKPVETYNSFITKENQKILWDKSVELAGL